MQDLWKRLEDWLRSNAPLVYDGLRTGASDEQLEAIQARLGVRLPEDFAEAYRVHDGQHPAAPWLVNAKELLSLERVADEWGVWKGLLDRGSFDFTGSDGGEPVGPVRSDWWNPRWVPFTYDGAGNHDCLDLDPPEGGNRGQVISMWHDDPERRVLAPSFRAWFERFVEEVESGSYVYREDYSALVRADEV